MTVLMFKPRFAEAVRAYTKLQTIRPPRKRPIRVGDHLSLRQWAGKAYRSPQLALAFGRCTEVSRIVVDPFGIHWQKLNVSRAEPADFAIADGFDSWAAMREWFDATHGLPFFGVLIRWEKAEALP